MANRCRKASPINRAVRSLDKYVNGERVEEESKLLYTDRYKGNPAEIDIGTGPALQAGEAVPEGLVPVGTPPTPASSRA